MLLNGVSRKVIYCRRGGRQQDPLSSLPFVLQPVMNIAIRRQDLLHLPIPNMDNEYFPLIQYVDDTLLVMEACHRQLFVLKSLFNTFADFTGLQVNYNK